MYTIVKIFSVSCSHSLCLNYQSPCNSLHGHNYKIEVGVVSDKLSKETGMVDDFSRIKEVFENTIKKEIDHRHLNNLEAFRHINPTVELLAKYIYSRLKPKISNLSFIKIWETDTSYCEYKE